MARRILETWEQARDLYQLGIDLYWADLPLGGIMSNGKSMMLGDWAHFHNLYGFAVEVEESDNS